MRKNTAKSRHSLSKRRQALWQKLSVMEQRSRDMEIAKALGAPEVDQKTEFCRQEIAKLRKVARKLERGVSRQRAWVRG